MKSGRILSWLNSSWLAGPSRPLLCNWTRIWLPVQGARSYEKILWGLWGIEDSHVGLHLDARHPLVGWQMDGLRGRFSLA